MTTNSHPGPMVGRIAPDFTMPAVAGEEQPHSVRRDDYRGKWLILVFYPRDFSFVCPTELTAFSGRLADFRHRNCELLGVSVDSIELHQEWLQTPADAGGLGPLQFPLASDADGDVSRSYRVWVEEKRVSTRGLFVIDPQGILQYAVVHNLSVGRSPEEVLRVLDALRTGGLCPASWTTADGTLDVDNALKPGRILGHYRIRDTLGHGTFGTVFAAWDLHLERMVALKVLGRAGEAAHNVLLTEARAAAGLSHPNICTVYAVEEEDGLPLIAMEHLPGPALPEFIGGKPAISEVRRVASQIAAGLAAAHARDVVHGDLKPANIMLADEGAPKILDFGLARRLQQAATSGPDNAETALRKATARGETDASAQESVATVVIDSPGRRRVVGRHNLGDAGLHVARTGVRQTGLSRKRRVLLRPDSLRDAHRLTGDPGEAADGRHPAAAERRLRRNLPPRGPRRVPSGARPPAAASPRTPPETRRRRPAARAAIGERAADSSIASHLPPAQQRRAGRRILNVFA
jgi:alkyl hydroperoxide reductase subunit AhpC